MNWKQIPTLASLRAFEAAARHRSLTRAAQELNVTHAAIAQHIRGLEADFAESLIVRQGRGVAPTPIGQQLADSLQSGFLIIADGVEQLRSRSEIRPLNISVTPAFAANWLMPRIGDFWAKHPEVSLSINPSIGLVDLRRDGIDLAIRYGDGKWPGVKAEMLTDGDFWVVVQPDLIKDRLVQRLQDVADLPWLLEDQMMERNSMVEREGVNIDKLNVTVLATNSLVMSAAKAGLGVTIQPKSLVQGDVQAGGLAKVCELNQENLGYYIVVLAGREPKGLRPFLSWLRSQAAE